MKHKVVVNITAEEIKGIIASSQIVARENRAVVKGLHTIMTLEEILDDEMSDKLHYAERELDIALESLGEEKLIELQAIMWFGRDAMEWSRQPGVVGLFKAYLADSQSKFDSVKNMVGYIGGKIYLHEYLLEALKYIEVPRHDKP